MVCHLPHDPLHAHARLALTTAPPKTKSWFHQVRRICAQYDLPTPLDLVINPFPKKFFKKLVKTKVVEYWQAQLRLEVSSLSSLKYFRPELYFLTRAHYMWTTAATNPYECSKSTVLARMASGRYRSEALCRHWSSNRSGYCRAPTCYQVFGTLEHLLATCPALHAVRERLYSMWLNRSVMFPTLHATIRSVLSSDEQTRAQFVLEPFAFPD